LTDEANNVSNEDIIDARQTADRLFSVAEVEASMDRMARAITDRLRHSNPLILTVMTGGMMPTGMLLTRLDFPLQVDYIHLTRYGDKTTGGEIQWIRQPPAELSGRTILLVDDLLDRGETLQTAVDRCHHNGAGEVLTAVLLVKSVAQRAGLAKTDFHALTAPDRYVFGFGMDYKHYWRNGPGIFAVRGS
jgi:hypoxanthine phosphoribosyltransferase